VDADRALTAAGRERVRAVSRMLVELGEEPLGVITSPLVRAVQTAEIVAQVTLLGGRGRGDTVRVRRQLSPSGDADALMRSLASERAERVMLVGHQPDLSELVSQQLGGFDRSFEKAMVVGLAVPPHVDDPRRSQSVHPGSKVRLRFVLDPKTLRLDPDARGGP
ncbi:MAG: SixA phosphatase family protein, partial [Polyangiaceae bacterium]